MKHSYSLIRTFLQKSPSRFNQFLILSALALIPFFTTAQVAMTGIGTPTYTQNFNSLINSGTANWLNNQTLPGWYVQQDTKIPTVITSNNGSNPNAELFSLGDGAAPDRGLGSISSEAAGKFVYVLRLKNSTNALVNTINVTFDLVQWWNNPGSSEKFGVSYKAGSTGDIEAAIANRDLNANTGWTVVDNKIKVPSKGRPGYKAGDRKTVTLDIAGLSLAVGAEIMIRFEDAMSTKNKGYNTIGIDNVSITANPATNALKIYHFVGGGNGNNSTKNDLTVLTNWKTNKNGTGTSPANFTDNFQLFLIDVPKNNNGNGPAETQAPVLQDGQNWVVSGQGSKVILGDGSQAFELTIAPTASFTATIDLRSASNFNIDNPNFNANLPGFTPIDIDLVETNSTVNYRGNANVQQYISEADYYNLSVSGSAIKNLSGNTSATASLNLNNTNKLYLNDVDLLVGNGTDNPGTITGSGTTGYIVTNSKGTLQRVVMNNNTEVFFPIGLTSYNPAKLKQTAASTTDIFSARVQSGLFDLYNPDNTGVDPPVVDGVSRSWIIEEALPGGSNANLSLLFSNNNTGNDWAPSFDPGKAVLAQYMNSWTAPTNGKANPSSQNMLEVSQGNITTFRIFGVMNYDHQGLVPLPVELLSFNAARVNGLVELKWSTASEKNNDYFSLEQSTDGYAFKEIAKVKGAGNSNRQVDYRFLHKNAPGHLIYYRLKQTDLDGTVSYSKIVAVDGTLGTATLSVYPNPGPGRYKITGADALVEATVTDATGRTVKKITTLGKDYSFDLSDQKSGTYFLRLTSGKEVKTLRLIKN